jgi:type III secretory pathway lipoprotein EscJ
MAMASPYLLTGILLLAVSCTSAVRSDKPEDTEQLGVDELLGKSFLPNQQDEKLLREHAMAGELARSIGELDGVDRARVHLTLADRSIFSRDRKTETKVAILVRRSPGAKPDAAALESLAVAAIPGLKADSVQLFFSGPEKVVQKTAFVGPVEVVSSSVGMAKVWFGGLLALCALLALSVIGAGLKLRKTRLKR